VALKNLLLKVVFTFAAGALVSCSNSTEKNNGESIHANRITQKDFSPEHDTVSEVDDNESFQILDSTNTLQTKEQGGSFGLTGLIVNTGLCTATRVIARHLLTAAHCVNTLFRKFDVTNSAGFLPNSTIGVGANGQFYLQKAPHVVGPDAVLITLDLVNEQGTGFKWMSPYIASVHADLPPAETSMAVPTIGTPLTFYGKGLVGYNVLSGMSKTNGIKIENNIEMTNEGFDVVAQAEGSETGYFSGTKARVLPTPELKLDSEGKPILKKGDNLLDYFFAPGAGGSQQRIFHRL
jgi:hypothetical protein